MKKRYQWHGMLYLIPAFAVIIVFQLIPIFYALIMSFFKGPINNPADQFIGFGHYANLLVNRDFWNSIYVTLYYVIGTVPISIFLSLLVALMLNQKIKGQGFYRTIYFLPVITSINAVSIVWNWLYHNQYGLINYGISQVVSGVGKFISWIPFVSIDTTADISINWLGDPRFAMPAIIIMSVWKGLGYNIVIFLAGLQQVPSTLYDAAKIDGAGKWSTFWNVTWPMISPTTFFILIMSTISSFQVFAQVWMMTQGGPQKSTTVVVYYLYENAFTKFNNYGYASSIAFVLFLMILAMTIVQKLLVEKRVHYN